MSNSQASQSVYAAEKASLYSTRGERGEREAGLPTSTIHSERNSLYHGADAASLMSTRSGNAYRGRNDSLTGLTVGSGTGGERMMTGKASRRGSMKGSALEEKEDD